MEEMPRAIAESGVQLSCMHDVTPMPHNGCRPPKKTYVKELTHFKLSGEINNSMINNNNNNNTLLWFQRRQKDPLKHYSGSVLNQMWTCSFVASLCLHLIQSHET